MDSFEIARWLRVYERVSGADACLIAFNQKGIIYTVERKAIPCEWVTAEKNSDGGYSLRLRIKSAERKKLIASGASQFCTEEELLCLPYKNNGIALERLYKIRHGIEWDRHDNRPFTKCGDVTINGRQIQIKYNSATLATVAMLARLE